MHYQYSYDPILSLCDFLQINILKTKVSSFYDFNKRWREMNYSSKRLQTNVCTLRLAPDLIGQSIPVVMLCYGPSVTL